MKKKNKNKSLILIVSVLIVVIAGFIFSKYSTERNAESPILDQPEYTEPTVAVVHEEEAPVIMDRFLKLYWENSDLVGWIRVPNTPIDYPVVYCKDNAFYLKHNFSKNSSSEGIPFLDMGADLLEKNQSLSIYGHYLKNGKMFTALHRYKDLEYYKSYPDFEFDTLYENGYYKIFSVFYMAGNQTDEYFYYYPVSRFASDDAFMQHVSQLLTRSIFNIPVDVIPGDQIVMMTCCTYETKNLRLIVAGRKIRPGESFDVDTDSASINPSPLFPKKWYDAKGGKPPVISN